MCQLSPNNGCYKLFYMHRHTYNALSAPLRALQPRRTWLSASLVKVYTGRYFLCKLNKSWLFIRSDYGTWMSSAVKLKVKPAVAEIELHSVSNVKSRSSLTVIKRSSIQSYQGVTCCKVTVKVFFYYFHFTPALSPSQKQTIPKTSYQVF